MTYAESEDPRHARSGTLRRVQGSILRHHRELAARSLADVAAAAQCSPAHLSEVERGRKDVSAERLVGIAAALDVPLHVLYSDIAEALAPPAYIDARAVERDPRLQIELAAARLNGDALRTVAQFSTYLVTASQPARRRIGFAVPHQEGGR